jgi:PAS domain S-box-containing protein
MHTPKKTSFDLEQQLKLQEILIEIASDYINVDEAQVDSVIQASLEKMCRFVNADRSYIFDYDFIAETTSNTYEWCNDGVEPEIQNLQDVPMELFPQWISEHQKGRPFYVPDVLALDADGSEGGLRSILEPQGIKSLIAIPLLKGKDLFGFVGFDSVREYHIYSDKEQQLLHLFGQMLINIRMRRRWENTLRIQEEKYRNILANMNLGLLEVDPDDNILFANQSFCDMSGYLLEEMKGQKAAEMFVPEEKRSIIYDKNSIREKNISDGYELQILDKHGNRHWWYVSGGPNYDDKGNFIGSIGIHLDITQQKKLELELAGAKIVAEQAARAKELFLANMSHEIRTPLNVIIGMVRELAKQNLGADQRFYVAQSDSAAKHLLTILNHILDMAKIDSGELSLEQVDFSLSAVAANAFSILDSQAREKNLDFKLSVDDALFVAYVGDEGRLRQILINILGNAIKFTEEGSVNFRVDLIMDLPAEQQVRLTVADTGIGMSEHFQKRLFGKFAQEESEANRKYEGTGLGLTIARELVTLMGGDISVRSKQGIGTTFTIELTLPKGNPKNLRQTAGMSEKNAFEGLHILLVEDNEMNRFIALQSLHHFGFTVDEAENGRIAVNMAANNRYDLILMDIQMPEMDGVEATLQILNTLHLKIPIIALTANAFRHDIERYFKAGMVDCVTKPYSEEELFNKLRLYLKFSKNRNAEESNSREAGPNTLLAENDAAGAGIQQLYDLSPLVKMSQGDEVFVQKMVDMFVMLTDRTITELQVEMQQSNFDQVSRIAHRIKPSLENMGILQLSTPIRQLENYPPEGDLTGRQELVDHIIEILKQVTAQIRARR